jgi:hypothetical protein
MSSAYLCIHVVALGWLLLLLLLCWLLLLLLLCWLLLLLLCRLLCCIFKLLRTNAWTVLTTA